MYRQLLPNTLVAVSGCGYHPVVKNSPVLEIFFENCIGRCFCSVWHPKVFKLWWNDDIKALLLSGVKSDRVATRPAEFKRTWKVVQSPFSIYPFFQMSPPLNQHLQYVSLAGDSASSLAVELNSISPPTSASYFPPHNSRSAHISCFRSRKPPELIRSSSWDSPS